jgi:hypothetical protein
MVNTRLFLISYRWKRVNTAKELSYTTKSDEVLISGILKVVTANSHAKELGIREYVSTPLQLLVSASRSQFIDFTGIYTFVFALQYFSLKNGKIIYKTSRILVNLPFPRANSYLNSDSKTARQIHFLFTP